MDLRLARRRLVAAFSALWANLHASFFFAPLIFGIYAVGRYGKKGWQWFAWAAAISLIAPLANPYGWRLYQHIFRDLTDSDLLSRIAEFQSFDFHTAGAGQIVAALILGIVGGTLAFTQRRYEHALLAAVVSVLAIRSARALPLVALLLLPLANLAITPLLDKRIQAFGQGLRSIHARFSGLLLAPLS